MAGAIDYILEGLEAELELERELGVRTVEIDRSLLAEIAASQSVQQPSAAAIPAAAVMPAAAAPVAPPCQAADAPKVVRASAAEYDFVFLHHAPLDAGGTEMMAKIVAAMKKTAQSAPVVHDGDLPTAKVYVVLGSAALKKWFPACAAAPGQWISDDASRSILVTYSPVEILRFPIVTPAVKKIKLDMWNCLKGVMQRIAL